MNKGIEVVKQRCNIVCGLLVYVPYFRWWTAEACDPRIGWDIQVGDE